MKKRLFTALTAIAVATITSITALTPVKAWEEGKDMVDMYRLYNPNSSEHFYTASEDEKNYLVKLGWSDEGLGWTAPTAGEPVYRLYNKNSGDHHYTLSEGEKNALVKLGWNDEGIGWYSATEQTCSEFDVKLLPLYRQYNPNASTGSHNYTTADFERDYLIDEGWDDEGIGWYGTCTEPIVLEDGYQLVYTYCRECGTKFWGIHQTEESDAHTFATHHACSQFLFKGEIFVN